MEYIILGILKGGNQETVLATQLGGKPITDEKIAKRYANKLETVYGCSNVRIETREPNNNINDKILKNLNIN